MEVTRFAFAVSFFNRLDPNSNKYEPKDRKWLKEKIFAHLRGQAK